MRDMRSGRPLIDVIATREYDVDGKPGITIAIAKPVLEDDGITWRCDYDVDGPMEQVRFYACGVDAFQALVLAIYCLEVTLDTSELNMDGRLSWLGEKGLIALPRCPVTVPRGAEQAALP